MQQVYWVEDNVLGGRCGPDCMPWDPAELYAGGVRAIVSLDRHGVDEAAISDAGIIHLPMYLPMILLETEADRHTFLQAVTPVFDFVEDMRRRQAPVIVHCHYGRDRTGAVLSCCLHAKQGLGARAGIEHVRGLQPGALTAPGYAEAVELFELLRKTEGR